MAEAAQDDQSSTAPANTMALLDRSFDQAAMAELRHELQRRGAANGLADRALFNFVLAINEIVTNAVRYAGGRGHLRLWRHGDDLWCQVADAGPGIPRSQFLDRPRTTRPGDLAGHGLWLARHICDAIEIDSDRSGTRVLLRFALPTVGRRTGAG